MRFNEEDEEKYLKLINNTRRGSNKDFEELFRRYWPLVRRLWQRYNISGLELADWEQEARVVMLEVIRLYNNQGPRMFSCFFKECLTTGFVIFNDKLRPISGFQRAVFTH